MIKEKEIQIVISTSNYNKYKDKYGPYNKGDKINININDVSKNSIVKVTAICKFCNSENKVRFQNYNMQIKKGGYYCCKKCTSKKVNESMIKNNSSYFLCNPEFKIKMKKLYNEDNPSKLKHIKELRRKQFKDVEYRKKVYKGVIDKFGVDNVSKLDFIKNLKIETCLKNYGVENPMQNEKIFIKAQKSGKRIKRHKNTGLYFRGTYEQDFLDYCFNNNIKVNKGKTIKFKYNNKNKVYFSDFYIKEKNLIVEIKSSYYYDKYINLNLLKKEETIKQGYNYLFIINKNYNEFENYFK